MLCLLDKSCFETTISTGSFCFRVKRIEPMKSLKGREAVGEYMSLLDSAQGTKIIIDRLAFLSDSAVILCTSITFIYQDA